MRWINISEPILFRFHEEKLLTNPKDSPAATRHRMDLHFSLINATENDLLLDGRRQVQIVLTFHLGQSSESLFLPDTSDSDFGSIHGPEGFAPSVLYKNPIKKNQLALKLAVNRDASVRFAAKSSLSFHWKGMTTCAPEGFSNISLSFVNIPELEDVSLTHSLYKQYVYANIVSFFVSPSGGASGSAATLNWCVENADSGMILPMGYDIFGSSGRTSSLKIQLDQRCHYYLNIQNAHGNVYRDLYTHILPPVISHLELAADRKLSWEAHDTCRAELMIKAAKTSLSSVDPVGSCKLKDDVSEAALRFHGLYTVTRKLCIPLLSEILLFTLEICRLPSHQCLSLRWHTMGMDRISVRAWDGDYYILSKEEKGNYVQAYPLGVNVTFCLDYSCSSGTGSLLLDNSDLSHLPAAEEKGGEPHVPIH